MDNTKVCLSEKDLDVLEILIQRARREYEQLAQLSGSDVHKNYSQISDIELISHAFAEMSYAIYKDTELYKSFKARFSHDEIE